LQELPDPISRATWDNYITMSPIDIDANKFSQLRRGDNEGNVVNLTVNGVVINSIPVFPQPGQTPGTIGLALGYGRSEKTGKVAFNVGKNAYPATQWINGTFQYTASDVSIVATADKHEFACTQSHNTIMGREEQILRETSLNEYKENTRSGNPVNEMHTYKGHQQVGKVDLWAAHDRYGNAWGLQIDLSACIGCGSCVVSCTAENNVAVVGKDQVKRTREMHWIRIDRYYSSDMTREVAHEKHVGAKQMYLDMEIASAKNPKVTFQPMMCQHCNHAPCETVCPVLATSHSNDGLNHMTYNRCIGTRYCANNCPYKVRRFNWFNYNKKADFKDINPTQSELGRMVLNPDVVVRSRGVMEKCSMCVQRIQDGKLKAKKEMRPLKDGDIKMACEAACATGAILFGDLNNPDSRITKSRGDDRSYFVLEEVGIKPSVGYLTKVRNQDERINHEEHGGGHGEHEAKAGHDEAVESKEHKKEEAHH
jgi:Fe-S-cluster-containing dehydrogenase component